MRILVMGAGGLGSAYGALLTKTGHQVTFVARGEHLKAMQAKGLELRRPDSTLKLDSVDAIEHPRPGEFELVLFTVKTYDTDAAIEALHPAVGAQTAVLSFQNGVEGVDKLGEAFGRERVIAGTTTLNGVMQEPGVVQDMGVRVNSTLAELSGGVTDRVEAIATAFTEAGLPAVTDADPYLTLWRKFVMFVPHALISSACAQTIGPIFSLAEGEALYRQVATEAVAVARASNVALPADMVESLMAVYKAAPAGARSSMSQDYERQRKVELEDIGGTVSRRGKAVGVATPCIDALYTVLKVRALAFGGLSAG